MNASNVEQNSRSHVLERLHAGNLVRVCIRSKQVLKWFSNYMYKDFRRDLR
jgi:hypothetical protein